MPLHFPRTPRTLHMTGDLRAVDLGRERPRTPPVGTRAIGPESSRDVASDFESFDDDEAPTRALDLAALDEMDQLDEISSELLLEETPIPHEGVRDLLYGGSEIRVGASYAEPLEILPTVVIAPDPAAPFDTDEGCVVRMGPPPALLEARHELVPHFQAPAPRLRKRHRSPSLARRIRRIRRHGLPLSVWVIVAVVAGFLSFWIVPPAVDALEASVENARSTSSASSSP